MYVNLNLATNPQLTHRRFYVGAAAVGLVGGLLFLILGAKFYSLRKADAELRASTQKIQQQMKVAIERRNELDRFFSQPDTAKLQDRANFIGAVIQARSFNWTQMFMDLERTMPAGVHVVRIDPKLENGTVAVKFVVGAASPEAKLKVLKAFEDSRSFSQVQLLREHAATQPGGDPFTVEFTAVYKTI